MVIPDKGQSERRHTTKREMIGLSKGPSSIKGDLMAIIEDTFKHTTATQLREEAGDTWHVVPDTVHRNQRWLSYEEQGVQVRGYWGLLQQHATYAATSRWPLWRRPENSGYGAPFVGSRNAAWHFNGMSFPSPIRDSDNMEYNIDRADFKGEVHGTKGTVL